MGASPVIFFIHTAKVLHETVKTCQYVKKMMKYVYFLLYLFKNMYLSIFSFLHIAKNR